MSNCALILAHCFILIFVTFVFCLAFSLLCCFWRWVSGFVSLLSIVFKTLCSVQRWNHSASGTEQLYGSMGLWASHWCSFLGGENGGGGKTGQWMCRAPQGVNWRSAARLISTGSTKTPLQVVLHSVNELVSLPTQSLNALPVLFRPELHQCPVQKGLHRAHRTWAWASRPVGEFMSPKPSTSFSQSCSRDPALLAKTASTFISMHFPLACLGKSLKIAFTTESKC